MATIEIEPMDVIRLIEQYLKENSLFRTLQTLQDESGVSLKTVDSVETFVHDINSGRWDTVLKIVQPLKLADKKLMDLYEQIAIEMIELREIGAARLLIRSTDPMKKLKEDHPDRYIHLENLLGRSYFDGREAYPDGGSKEKRRAAIAQSLKNEVSVVPSQRLLTLINDALKWQKNQGLLPQGTSIDIFTGKTQVKKIEDEAPPNMLHKHCIEAAPPETEDDVDIAVFCSQFSPDGRYLVVGFSTGIIEVWNPTTGKLAKDLRYQKDNPMMTVEKDDDEQRPLEAAVFSLCFSSDSEVLAAGDGGGNLRAWRLQTGERTKYIRCAHLKTVSCIKFNHDNSQMLSGSHDTTLRIHGMKSGRLLKEFRGHTSFVNDVTFNHDGTNIISGSSDGTIRVWNAKTTECIHTHKGAIMDVRVHTVSLVGNSKNDYILVGTQSDSIKILKVYQGKISKQEIMNFTIKKSDSEPKSNIVACCASPKGEWIYAVDDRNLYCFNCESGLVEKTINVHEKKAMGVSHHPFLNMMTTFDEIGNLKLWKA